MSIPSEYTLKVNLRTDTTADIEVDKTIPYESLMTKAHKKIKLLQLIKNRIQENQEYSSSNWYLYNQSITDSLHSLKTKSWGLCCQKQVSQAGISNYIPQFTVGGSYLSLPEIPASGYKVLSCPNVSFDLAGASTGNHKENLCIMSTPFPLLLWA